MSDKGTTRSRQRLLLFGAYEDDVEVLVITEHGREDAANGLNDCVGRDRGSKTKRDAGRTAHAVEYACQIGTINLPSQDWGEGLFQFPLGVPILFLNAVRAS